ncbi:MAG: hypothetical protein NDI60_00050 [Elusimicrobiales bacterium]|nr:hypothetical protein [Elusimicrobiales bacterium]
MNFFLKSLALVFLLCSQAGALDCPRGEEKAEDCPWAGAARLLTERAEKKEPLEPVFSAQLPGLLRQLDMDRASPALQLWGESINFDELAKGTIVHPGILEFLSSRLGAPQPKGRIAHAGLEHTYGYLFSLLPTKFGFKRARWVRPDIEDGLGLPRGSAGPAPSEGTLLANITCLAGGIALKDDPAAAALLQRMAPYCGSAVRAYAARPLKRGRLTEEVSLPGGRQVTLRTDFAPFKAVYGGNTHLLVYSVYDSAIRRAYLVTAFPVNAGFVNNALSPSGLGAGKPVQTRYNAHVEGLTGAGKLKGSRTVTIIEQ